MLVLQMLIKSHVKTLTIIVHMHEREEFFNVKLNPFTSISNVRGSTELFLLSGFTELFLTNYKPNQEGQENIPTSCKFSKQFLTIT